MSTERPSSPVVPGIDEPVIVGGPFFDDLSVGEVSDESPAMTITEGHAALHQAIVGDRLRLPLDAELCRRVTGARLPIAHPNLVCDIAIGQSTLPTQRVIGNLFYRGLVLRRAPSIGDTLYTHTEIVALRRNRAKEGREPTGLAAMRITTRDQKDRLVLDFHRCAMLPAQKAAAEGEEGDDIDALVPAELPPRDELDEATRYWDMIAYGAQAPGAGSRSLEPGCTWVIEGGDSVSCAPELARLSLNLAQAHRDPTANPSGRRLVYGGHTIGIAAAQVTQALPKLAYIVGWRECSHLGPVEEGDVLTSRVTLEAISRLPRGGTIADLRSEVSALHPDGTSADVLDWRLVAVIG